MKKSEKRVLKHEIKKMDIDKVNKIYRNTNKLIEKIDKIMKEDK